MPGRCGAWRFGVAHASTCLSAAAADQDWDREQTLNEVSFACPIAASKPKHKRPSNLNLIGIDRIANRPIGKPS